MGLFGLAVDSECLFPTSWGRESHRTPNRFSGQGTLVSPRSKNSVGEQSFLSRKPGAHYTPASFVYLKDIEALKTKVMLLLKSQLVLLAHRSRSKLLMNVVFAQRFMLNCPDLSAHPIISYQWISGRFTTSYLARAGQRRIIIRDSATVTSKLDGGILSNLNKFCNCGTLFAFTLVIRRFLVRDFDLRL